MLQYIPHKRYHLVILACEQGDPCNQCFLVMRGAPYFCFGNLESAQTCPLWQGASCTVESRSPSPAFQFNKPNMTLKVRARACTMLHWGLYVTLCHILRSAKWHAWFRMHQHLPSSGQEPEFKDRRNSGADAKIWTSTACCRVIVRVRRLLQDFVLNTQCNIYQNELETALRHRIWHKLLKPRE